VQVIYLGDETTTALGAFGISLEPLQFLQGIDVTRALEAPQSDADAMVIDVGVEIADAGRRYDWQAGRQVLCKLRR
jgi:hypothetical protein